MGYEQAEFRRAFLFDVKKELVTMTITVTGRKMPVTDALRD